MTDARRRGVRGLVTAAWIAATLALVALGTWQVQRLAWKRDLIARVDARVHAKPVAAPATAGKEDEYRRVTATGIFLAARDSFVQASTVRGPGWWVLTPLRTDGGRTILINRGYAPTRAIAPVGSERVTIVGLLRLTEPGGGFLRHNDPAADRWYSRDVAAIAARRGIGPVAPYFIDQEALPERHGQPVGGLTVIRFPNNHLVYAITWYMLAVMSAGGFLYSRTAARRDERDPR